MISFLFLSRVASRWLAHRREHAPWKPRQSECSAVWEAPSLKPHQAVSDESLHIAAKSSSSWPILLEGYLYFRLKANLLLLWEAKCPAVSHRAAGWSTHSFCVPVFLVHSTSFWLIHRRLSRSHLTWPPTVPCHVQAQSAAVLQGQGWGPALSSSSPHPGC